MYEISMIICGLLASWILFHQYPIIKSKALDNKLRIHCSNIPHYILSIVIPARNEEHNIANLLEDLRGQDYAIHEIICVDDGSTDRTRKVIEEFHVTLIKIDDKAKDWMGKAWACQVGGQIATGELILFLDADVRLKKDGISALIQEYHKEQCVISLQPYHEMKCGYEQASLFFNLVQIAGNGVSSFIKNRYVGLFGPLILFPTRVYKEIGGHNIARYSIVDDLTIGEGLKKRKIPFRLYLGGEHISYRMYGNGIKGLIEGWTKNYATGAGKTPWYHFILVFMWINGLTTVSILSFQMIYQSDIKMGVTLFYLIWVLELIRIGKPIGNFKIYTVLFFPLYLVIFIILFLISIYKRVFSRKVTWKDRKIKLEK